jgi:two-component system chemotaxis response regulator CheB
MRRPIRVLVVDDSPVVRALLREGLGADPAIQVVGVAQDAYEARDLIVRLSPDVLTLDLEMPRMDGLDFLRRLMPQYPLPVVMVTSAADRGPQVALDALAAGAVDFVAKPSGARGMSAQEMLVELRTKVKIASTVDVSHWKHRRAEPAPAAAGAATGVQVIAIGASTGGTEAIRAVLKGLPAQLPGIVIVQHMPAGFTRTFAEQLNASTPLRCAEAQDGDPVRPGTALVAPGGRQIEVVAEGGQLLVRLRGEERHNNHCPSVDVMMRSVAAAAGARSLGVLLTGMGSDGALGMLAMRQAGAITLAQDEQSCVVFGMPREAWACGGATAMKPLDGMAAAMLDALASVRPRSDLSGRVPR